MTNIHPPYFAKCIPIEGPIQIGDQFRLYGQILTANQSDAELGPTEARQKVKMVLCSRDIMLEDTDLFFGNHIPYQSPIGISKIFKPHDSLGVYKVIGPISKEALVFVQENDEFYNSQVSRSGRRSFSSDWNT